MRPSSADQPTNPRRREQSRSHRASDGARLARIARWPGARTFFALADALISRSAFAPRSRASGSKAVGSAPCASRRHAASGAARRCRAQPAATSEVGCAPRGRLWSRRGRCAPRRAARRRQRPPRPPSAVWPYRGQQLRTLRARVWGSQTAREGPTCGGGGLFPRPSLWRRCFLPWRCRRRGLLRRRGGDCRCAARRRARRLRLAAGARRCARCWRACRLPPPWLRGLRALLRCCPPASWRLS